MKFFTFLRDLWRRICGYAPIVTLGHLMIDSAVIRGERRELRPWVRYALWTPIIAGILVFAVLFAGLGVK